MKRLPIDFGEIAELMQNVDHESEYYLDTVTGAVVIIPPELLDLESYTEEAVPEWERELIPIARDIDAGGERYVPIPEFDSYEGYYLMVRFAGSVGDPKLRQLLAVALEGKGAFRRFKNALRNHPDEQKRWFAFRDAMMAERICEWLQQLDIEPLDGPVQPT